MTGIDVSPRQALEQALITRVDTSLQPLPVDEPIPEWFDGVYETDATSDWANTTLYQVGGYKLLMDRLPQHMRRLWHSAGRKNLLLDAFIMPDPHEPFSQLPTNREPYKIIAMSAILRQAKRKSSQGLYTPIGYRMKGNEHDVIPLGVNTELAFAANAIVHRRSWETA
jgi:hypothetical protein